MADIQNFFANQDVQGTENDDVIDNYGEGALVHSFGGNDVIRNFYSTITTLQGNMGNDTIYNFREYTLINSGEGDDYVGNSASNVTICGGGDDDIFLLDKGLKNVRAYGDDGNDIIQSFSDLSTIDGGSGDDAVTNYYATNVVMCGGYGENTLTNYGENVTIFGGEDIDFISNYSSNVTVSGGSGDDSINSASDLIYISVEGGAGSDTIQSRSNWSTLDGGVGDDTLINYGDNCTITHGKSDGNDTITNYGRNLVVYFPDATFDDLVYFEGLPTNGNSIKFSDSSSIFVVGGVGYSDYASEHVLPDSAGQITYKFSDGGEYLYRGSGVISRKITT